MIDVQPKVFLVNEPQVNVEGMLAYLKEVTGESDGGAWWRRVGAKIALGEIPSSEGLVEFMGRLCYKSWDVGLNRNVTKIREDRKEYLQNILKQAHGSVLGHAHFSFAIHHGSRVFTAELNRHQAGTDISEASLRYVRLDDEFPFRLPHSILKPESIWVMKQAVMFLEEACAEIYKIEGIDDQESFLQKKTITSAVRRIAPLGIATEEGWSGNIRSIRHVIEMRTNAGAEEEIRVIANQIAEIMAVRCPLLFDDYTRVTTEGDPTPAWETPYRKV